MTVPSRPAIATIALLAALHLTTATASAASPSAGVDTLMSSSVCILGDVPGGRFEASGFVVPPGEYVMTTAHGIGEARNLRVKLHDGRVFAARLERLGDESADLALLTIVGPRLPAVRFGSIADLAQGDPVRTVGCPSGFEFSLSQGVVSSIRPSDYGYPVIQTDVPVNPGSSGGPLFDREGRVVGVIKGEVAERQRIYFALPIDLGKILLEEVHDERRALELFNQAVLEARPEEKVRLYREVVSLEPALVEGHYNLAVVLEKLGRRAEAEAEYRETVRLRPDYAPAALNLGASLYEQKRYAEAVDVYQRMLKTSPGSVEVRNNLAEAYRALGRAQEARREFERILKLDSSYAPAHYGLALLYDDSLHDPRLAAAHYRRYLDLAPDAADAEQVREWLRRAEGGKGR